MGWGVLALLGLLILSKAVVSGARFKNAESDRLAELDRINAEARAEALIAFPHLTNDPRFK